MRITRRVTERLNTAIRAPRRTPLLQVLKSAIATIAAWLAASLVFPDATPVFAAIAALLVVQPSLNQSLAKALERSAGVIAGVAVASGLGMLFGEANWVVVIAIALGLLIAWALKMTAATANQVAISAILVIALGQTTPGYAVDRVLETILGAAIGVIANVAIVPPLALQPARERIDALGQEIAQTLDRLADSITSERTRSNLEELLLTARLLRPMQQSAQAAIDVSVDSLTLNPRARTHRHELHELSAQLEYFTPIVNQVVGMARAVYDRYDSSVIVEPAAWAISEQLHRAAHDVRLIQRSSDAVPHDTRNEEVLQPTAEVPALTTPLTIVKPSSDNWILIGALMEDLRRIHDTLSDR
ncbi:uncharacterized membrane protein YgaE (UPF0421/DUF939 family) [Microbacterium endophyticum]|uniref:Uncharacterized membrane protein YgaE (UPF0421/DUF939 family) n=1 Tax=Microbacterium endophyticum TaxID=1526412 RepID=A0A7W4V4N5_9MICO|nr:FUSC family protein [Microbacterium endophyticum]MBB2976802.1 uncharacterized membrane protein YgaE (UPF0421/DUF939 family) [Microbacterium endophyticum]NIK36561.1 uncharacterized membrane protein YgaE (UPF0421/DUF939 family) [Microbacterium endophyticum]